MGANIVSGEQLRSIVERIERLRQEKKSLGDDEAAVMAEAKSAGFVPAIIRTVIKARAQKPHDRQEANALFDMYMHALGMGDPPPLFRQLERLAPDPTSREAVIDALKKLAPAKGDIILRMGKKPVRLYRDKDGEAHVEDYVEPDRAPAASAPKRAPSTPKAEIPDVDGEGAEELGREAAKANRPVIDNPFPFGDPRRARFDEGWRKEQGNDGMGGD